jgi:hypothetical protein
MCQQLAEISGEDILCTEGITRLNEMGLECLSLTHDVVSLLRDVDADVRATALSMIPLVALKDDEAVIDAVMWALVHDSDDLVRQTAILVVSEMVQQHSR